MGHGCDGMHAGLQSHADGVRILGDLPVVECNTVTKSSILLLSNIEDSP